MQEQKYADLMQKIEVEELSKTIEVESIIQLLAIYLCEDKLADARFLWKRIPETLKKDNKELENLNAIKCALLLNNTPKFFQHMSYPWSAHIKQIMQELCERVRQNTFTLVGQAYISIFEEELMKLTQLSKDELKQECATLGWKYENDGHNTIIIPKRINPVVEVNASSEDLLLKLTDFVSFLEN